MNVKSRKYAYPKLSVYAIEKNAELCDRSEGELFDCVRARTGKFNQAGDAPSH